MDRGGTAVVLRHERRFLLRLWLVVYLLVGLLVDPVAWAQRGPQTTVREFCRLDAMGARATLQGWPQVAPLVAWPWEPAWDRVVLITSYTVGWPVAEEEGQFAIEVRYAVQGVVTAAGLREEPHVESRLFRVAPMPDGLWRITGPPPPPHIFADNADASGVQRSLAAGGVNFVANSTFVHRLFGEAGWEVPLLSTLEFERSDRFRVVKEPRPGDLVLYFDGAQPYHVGVLEQEAVVVSSTLNGGVVRTSLDTFAGDRKFLRLVEPEPLPTLTPTPHLPRTLPTSARKAAKLAAPPQRPLSNARAAQQKAHKRVFSAKPAGKTSTPAREKKSGGIER